MSGRVIVSGSRHGASPELVESLLGLRAPEVVIEGGAGVRHLAGAGGGVMGAQRCATTCRHRTAEGVAGWARWVRSSRHTISGHYAAGTKR
jgi:hypothetical protein